MSDPNEDDFAEFTSQPAEDVAIRADEETISREQNVGEPNMSTDNPINLKDHPKYQIGEEFIYDNSNFEGRRSKWYNPFSDRADMRGTNDGLRQYLDIADTDKVYANATLEKQSDALKAAIENHKNGVAIDRGNTLALVRDQKAEINKAKEALEQAKKSVPSMHDAKAVVNEQIAETRQSLSELRRLNGKDASSTIGELSNSGLITFEEKTGEVKFSIATSSREGAAATSFTIGKVEDGNFKLNSGEYNKAINKLDDFKRNADTHIREMMEDMKEGHRNAEKTIQELEQEISTVEGNILGGTKTAGALEGMAKEGNALEKAAGSVEKNYNQMGRYAEIGGGAAVAAMGAYNAFGKSKEEGGGMTFGNVLKMGIGGMLSLKGINEWKILGNKAGNLASAAEKGITHI